MKIQITIVPDGQPQYITVNLSINNERLTMREEILKLYKTHWNINHQRNINQLLLEKEVDSLIKDIKRLNDKQLTRLLYKYLKDAEKEEITIFAIRFEMKLRRKEKIEKLFC